MSNPFQPLRTEETRMAIRLVIFDIDGTILQTYSWQYIHENLGTWNEARGYLDQFFEKRIGYHEWARLDAALWKNQALTKITEIVRQMPYTEGAKEALAVLRERGIKIYLLSAGLTLVAQKIKEEAAIDGYAANRLLVKDGFLTGEVKVNVSFRDKDKHLPRILQKFDVTASECAAVGDDPTLIPLFRKVALAIAFNPTEKKVERNAHVTIREKDLRKILPYVLAGSAKK